MPHLRFASLFPISLFAALVMSSPPLEAQLARHSFVLRKESLINPGWFGPFGDLQTGDEIELLLTVDRSIPLGQPGLYPDAIVGMGFILDGRFYNDPVASSQVFVNNALSTWDPVLQQGDCRDRVQLQTQGLIPWVRLLFIGEVAELGAGTPPPCPTYLTSGDIPTSFLTPNPADTTVRLQFPGSSLDAEMSVLSETVSVGAPLNDSCASAWPLGGYYPFLFDNFGADTDGADLGGFCALQAGGDTQIHNDVWFTFRPEFNGCTHIWTFSSEFDTELAVYEANGCPDDPGRVIACSSSEMQPPSTATSAGLDVVLSQDRLYTIRVGGASATDRGNGFLILSFGSGALANDGGLQPGAPGCFEDPFVESCFGDVSTPAGCANCPCSNTAAPGSSGGCRNSAGLSGRLISSGSPSISTPFLATHDLRFAMSGATPDSFCFLASGAAVAPQNMNSPCFGQSTGANSVGFDGLRCVVQGIRRHGTRTSDANGEVGVTTRSWGGADAPDEGLGVNSSFVAGETRHFQVVYRDFPDQNCMTGLNTSQAVSVTFQP